LAPEGEEKDHNEAWETESTLPESTIGKASPSTGKKGSS
jgi:hypothetical protein